MKFEEIQAALTETPELLTAVQDHIFGMDTTKAKITEAANAIYTSKIGDEVKNIHGQYDGMMLTHLDEKPGTLEGGGRQKSYDKVKDLFEELKTLRGQKDSLNKDAEVIRLTNELTTLKNDPTNTWFKTLESEKSKWATKEADYLKQIKEGANGLTKYQVTTAAQSGLTGLEFKKEIPESLKSMAVENAIAGLTANSKIENDVLGKPQIIYLDANGAALVGPTGQPLAAAEILKDKLKEILVSKVPGGGGGADIIIKKGQIETTTVDGKASKKLLINPAQMTTQGAFITAAEVALAAAGITMENPEYTKLKDEAFVRYEVAKKPAQ